MCMRMKESLTSSNGHSIILHHGGPEGRLENVAAMITPPPPGLGSQRGMASAYVYQGPSVYCTLESQ